MPTVVRGDVMGHRLAGSSVTWMRLGCGPGSAADTDIRRQPNDLWDAGRPQAHSTIPIAVLFFVFQRYLVRGRLEGSVK